MATRPYFKTLLVFPLLTQLLVTIVLFFSSNITGLTHRLMGSRPPLRPLCFTRYCIDRFFNWFFLHQYQRGSLFNVHR